MVPRSQHYELKIVTGIKAGATLKKKESGGGSSGIKGERKFVNGSRFVFFRLMGVSHRLKPVLPNAKGKMAAQGRRYRRLHDADEFAGTGD
jgi:hypothetical protein